MKMTQGISMAVALVLACSVEAQTQTNAAPGANAAPVVAPEAPPAAPAVSTNEVKAAKEVKPAKPAAAKKVKKAAPKKTAAKPTATPAKADTNPNLQFSPIGTAVVKNDNVNVRGKPAFIGEVITRLKKGETVTLLEEIKLTHPKKDEPTNWFRISLPTNTPVWVFAQFIDDATKAVKSPRLNVRTGPGENYSVIARLKKGDVVKEIRKSADWIEIEAPASAFAFVAAEYLDKQNIAPSAPPPTELAVVPPTETVNVPPAEEIKPAPPAEVPAAPEQPAAPPKPEQPPAPTQPVVTTPEPAQTPEVLPKRIIKREGIVRKAWHPQAPTYYELEGLDNKQVINYLHSPMIQQADKPKPTPKFDLEQYRNRRVIVTGEEVVDKRWTRTPVLEIESIDLQQ